jgi:hypothetical protein
MRTRARWLSAAVAATLTVGVVLAAPAAHHAVRRETASVATRASVPTTASRARAVLRAWDDRRSEAWARGDTDALAHLYLPDSATGRRDVAMLTAYRRAGLRVTGMTRQVLRLRVVAAAPGRLALEVTDRLVDARLVGRGVRTAVAVGQPTSRRLRLARVDGRWMMSEVWATGQPAR